MPSPIAHIATGIAIGLLAKQLAPKSLVNPHQGIATQVTTQTIFMLTIIGSLLPDFDALLGIIMGDFGKYHNHLSHSFALGLGASLLITVLYASRLALPKTTMFLMLFSAYSLHILMDAATVTRGVMLLWPISENRFATLLPLFYGVRWSEGIFSTLHLITIITETLFAGVLWGLLKHVIKRRKLKL